MTLLALLGFGVLGLILGGVFSAQAEHPKLLDKLLMTGILGALILGVSLFPLGILGLFVGAIANWMLFDTTIYSG